MIPAKQLPINARAHVEALCEALRYHLYQILITGLIFDQQNEVIAREVIFALFRETRGAGDIYLTPDDRSDPLFFAGTVKRHGTVKDAVVCNSNSRVPRLFRHAGDIGDAAGTVEQAVFTVQVQVDEFSHD